MTLDTHADGVDREKDRERILGRFHPELRSELAGIEVRATRDGPLGWYAYPTATSPSRIDIREDANFEEVLGHELLHGANFQYKPFRDDAGAGFPRFWRAIAADYGATPQAWQQFAGDPFHAFTYLAGLALTEPEKVGLNVYRYFLPLRQVVTD